MSPNTVLTYEERVKMRRVLDDLDQKEAGGQKDGGNDAKYLEGGRFKRLWRPCDR